MRVSTAVILRLFNYSKVLHLSFDLRIITSHFEIVGEMKKLFLHVGNPKTGTTAVQNKFRDEKVVNGVEYINVAAGLNHRKLWFSITSELGRPRRGFEYAHGECYKLFSDIAKQIQESRSEKFLLSFEGFSAAPNFSDCDRILDTFKNIIGLVAEVYVIYLLRDPIPYLKSKYQSEIRSGKPLPLFSKWMLDSKKNILNQAIVYNYYATVFGKHAILCADYQEAKRRENLLGEFLYLMRANEQGETVRLAKDVNENVMSFAEVEALRKNNWLEKKGYIKSRSILNEPSDRESLIKVMNEADTDNAQLFYFLFGKEIQPLDMNFVEHLEKNLLF